MLAYDVTVRGTRLTLLKTLGIVKRHRRVLCRCSCGTEKEYNLDNLSPMKTQSCGCLRRANQHALGKASKRHGGTGTIEFTAFIQAKSRCNDTNRSDYKNYGGRGIKFLYSSFEVFLADVGKKPSPKLSLDRLDNDGNYEIGNCRWADARTQRNNQRA